jgi:hypothetical protein
MIVLQGLEFSYKKCFICVQVPTVCFIAKQELVTPWRKVDELICRFFFKVYGYSSALHHLVCACSYLTERKVH